MYNACRLSREAQEKGSFKAYALIHAFEETDVVVNDGYCTNGHATFFLVISIYHVCPKALSSQTERWHVSR